jgi:catechol 2,3-dioxygenase-like lactoylglutathione lyase family enzyme
MGFSRIITNICSDRLTESRDFYVTLLGFEVSYESDWYIQLRNPIDRESLSISSIDNPVRVLIDSGE